MLPATETDPSWLSRERGGDELMHQRLLNICLHNPIHQPPFPPTEMHSQERGMGRPTVLRNASNHRTIVQIIIGQLSHSEYVRVLDMVPPRTTPDQKQSYCTFTWRQRDIEKWLGLGAPWDDQLFWWTCSPKCNRNNINSPNGRIPPTRLGS